MPESDHVNVDTTLLSCYVTDGIAHVPQLFGIDLFWFFEWIYEREDLLDSLLYGGHFWCCYRYRASRENLQSSVNVLK